MLQSVDELEAEQAPSSPSYSGLPEAPCSGPLEGLINPTCGQMLVNELLAQRLFDARMTAKTASFSDDWQKREEWAGSSLADSAEQPRA